MASINIQSFSGDIEIASNLTVNANTFHVDSVAKRIGIGKTDPAFALDVSGTINATSLYAGGSELQTGPWSSNASNIYYTTGAVGVGTDSPTKTLEVQGTLRLSNATTGEVSDLHVIEPHTWDTGTPIITPDRYQGDKFGWSVAISGDGMYVIGGAPYDDLTYTDQGSVYIYNRTGLIWSSPAKLNESAADRAPNNNFGLSVALSNDGTYAIVGSPFIDSPSSDSGAAYIFTRTGTNTWTQQQKLVPTDGVTSDWFGFSVDISDDGTYAIVGTPLEEDPGAGTNLGCAYIFTRSGSSWTQQQKIVATDKTSDDWFGATIAISGDGNYAIVGAYYNDDGGTNSGSAYIFTRSGSTWTQQKKLVATDHSTGDEFARSVAISRDGTYALVGSPYDDDGNYNNGSVYSFKRTGISWDNGIKILPSDPWSGGNFGYSVDISPDGAYAIVGTPNYRATSTNQGAAHIFRRTGTNTWDTGNRIVAADALASDYFGWSVSISEDATYATVGAYAKDYIYSDTGGIYIFKQDSVALSSTSRITAAGSVLSFTGQHMCFPDGPMSQGQIVSANKNKYVSLNGPLTTGAQAIKSSESIPVVCLSNVVNDKNVFGVVDRHEHGGTARVQQNGIGNVTQEKERGDNRVIVNSIGEGAMWVTNTNGNLVSGDYITTSNVAGYGQKQDDDIVHSYTVAKITMDCDFEPEDLPIQVIKKDAEGNNILDTYGRIQWEDMDRTEKAYRIRYLTTEGQTTDQANAVWRAAYVGCTYHCG
jgi:hypothetical protein